MSAEDAHPGVVVGNDRVVLPVKVDPLPKNFTSTLFLVNNSLLLHQPASIGLGLLAANLFLAHVGRLLPFLGNVELRIDGGSNQFPVFVGD